MRQYTITVRYEIFDGYTVLSDEREVQVKAPKLGTAQKQALDTVWNDHLDTIRYAEVVKVVRGTR